MCVCSTTGQEKQRPPGVKGELPVRRYHVMIGTVIVNFMPITCLHHYTYLAFVIHNVHTCNT